MDGADRVRLAPALLAQRGVEGRHGQHHLDQVDPVRDLVGPLDLSRHPIEHPLGGRRQLRVGQSAGLHRRAQGRASQVQKNASCRHRKHRIHPQVRDVSSVLQWTSDRHGQTSRLHPGPGTPSDHPISGHQVNAGPYLRHERALPRNLNDDDRRCVTPPPVDALRKDGVNQTLRLAAAALGAASSPADEGALHGRPQTSTIHHPVGVPTDAAATPSALGSSPMSSNLQQAYGAGVPASSQSASDSGIGG